MNSRKTSISHVMNDNNVSNASDHHYQQQQQHQSTSGACSLKNILQSDDGPSSHVQHASSQHSQPPPPPQQYNHGGAGNSGSGGNNTVGYGGSYSNEQQTRDYYHHHHPRSHQPLHSHSQSSHHNHEQNNQPYSRDDEASSILLLLSNQTTQPSMNSNYISSRDPSYPQKDNEQQMSDVVEAATSLSSISNVSKSNSQQINQRPRAKSNSMSIASLCGDESGSSESGHSIPSGSSMETSQQKYHQPYPEDMRNGDINVNAHQQHNIVDYNNHNNLYSHRKHIKKPSNGPTPLIVNNNPKIPQKDSKVIQKREKRRPSEPNEYVRPKIHHHSNHFSHGPPTTSGGVKLIELREQLGEEKNINRISQIAPITTVAQAGMEWDRTQHSQPYHQNRSSHNVPPQAAYLNNHQPPISKSGGSPSLHGDSQKLSYMNNERQPKTSPTGPPVHAPNGYPHGHGIGGPVGGMIGTHQDVQPPQPSQQQPPQMPPLRGQYSAFSNQFHKKYNDMKHDPKMKRNAPHAYISYMIYTNQMDKSKDGHLQSQPPQNIPSRQIINGIPNGSPPLNDHGMVNQPMVSHNQPQVNGSNMGNMYSSRDPQHPGYPPIQPASTGYMHPSEAINPAQQRRVSDPPMHSHQSISGSRNVQHGYPPTHVNGSSIEEHQPPPQITHRHSISHNSSPSLLPTHSSSVNHHSSQRQILPNLLPATNQHPPPPQRHVPNPTSPSTSRSGSISQIQTALPPIQSNPSHLPSHHHHHNNSHTHHHHHYPQEHSNHQTHAHHGHSHHYHHQPVSQASQPPPPSYMSGPPAPLAQQHSYGGKSSPVPPQIPQSPPPPMMSSSRPSSNHYHHTSQQGPPQGGSNRHHHHHHHHHQPLPSEPVGPPVNSNPPSSNILSPPLTNYLDSRTQSNGYNSVHQHPHHLHHSTNGIGPAPVQIAPLGSSVQRGTPYY